MTNENTFDQLMNDILNQLSVNIGPISFHDRSSGYGSYGSNPYGSQLGTRTGYRPGNKTGTKIPIPNIKIGTKFTVKNVDELNETLLPVLDNKYRALGNSTQVEINKYYEILKEYTKEFLIKFIKSQSTNTLELTDYKPSATYKESYKNLIEIIAKLTDNKYFVDNESNVTSMTETALAHQLDQTIKGLESDIQEIETLFNDEMNKLEKKKKGDVYTKGYFSKLSSSGVSGLFSSSISKLDIKTDEYPSNYFMYLIWLGRTLRYFYCYKGTQLSFDNKGVSELEHITITLPTTLNIDCSNPLQYPLLTSLCDSLGKPVKGSLIIMTFLKIMVCHNIEFLNNATPHTNAAFKSIELIIDSKCPTIKLSPLEKITVTKEDKRNDNNIVITIIKFFKIFMLAVGTIGYKKCIDEYNNTEFNSIKFTTITYKNKYIKIFNRESITDIIHNIQLIEKGFNDNPVNSDIINDMFDIFNNTLIQINTLYKEDIPKFFIDWQPFFKFLNISPEDYKKIFIGYIDIDNTNPYPTLKYHNVDTNTTGDIISGFNIDNLNSCEHEFHMSPEIATKIKETVVKNVTWFFIEVNNFKNIYFTKKNKWFIYDHTSEPSEVTTLPVGEYKRYGCIHDDQIKKANNGEKFCMLEPIANIHDSLPEGIYKNNDDDNLYQYKDTKWYPISNTTIKKYTVNDTYWFEYPSYPPYGEYIKEDDVKENKKPYNTFIKFVNEQVKLANEEKEFTMNEGVAKQLKNNKEMYYEQVEDKSIILYKSDNEWHEKDQIGNIYIEDDRYINKQYKKKYERTSMYEIDGGSKIRKTIKKKYRKSKFLTRKNKKKRFLLKKPRTLKRKYKRIL